MIALDSDPAMVAAATGQLDRPAILTDGHDFQVDEEVDAVFSNAALHWMRCPAEVLRCVRHRAGSWPRWAGHATWARSSQVSAPSWRSSDWPTGCGCRGSSEALPSMPVCWRRPGVARMEYFPRPTLLVPERDCGLGADVRWAAGGARAAGPVAVGVVAGD